MSELCYLSATEALEKFKNKSLSPVELMHAVIKRAEESQQTVNAFSSTYFEEALTLAKRAEDKYVHGKPTGLVEGLPIAVKDEAAVAGKRTTFSSLVYKDNITEKNCAMVQRLIDQGGIVHARTTTPEFSSLFTTHSRLNGVTRNPWNLDITPGGSSGGSGAALATGSAMLATGSDIGGSIRMPASMCGVVGYKPPFGRVPQDDGYPFNLDTYCHVGPMARTVLDTALMENIICGPDPLDIASLKPKYELPLTYGNDLRGFKIAYSENLNYMDVEPDVIASLYAAIDVFKQLGATVVEVTLPWDERIDVAAQRHYRQIFGASMAEVVREHGDLVCDYTAAYVKESLKVASEAENYYKSMVVEAKMYESFGPMMETVDVFICPTVTSTNIPATHAALIDKVIINGQEKPDDMAMSLCHQFNMLSRCPVLTVPAALTRNGVPSGIQIVGKSYDDVSVFKAGFALESASEFWKTCFPR